jgi:hypothetical protein
VERFYNYNLKKFMGKFKATEYSKTKVDENGVVIEETTQKV